MKTIFKMILISLICFAGASSAFADLTLNLIAVNGSDQVKDIEVKSYLPKELEPSDILDAGLLTVQYDVDKGVYFISGKVSFQPKESKTFKVKVADVWKIAPEEVDILKEQVGANLLLLKKKENYETAKVARDKLIEQLDFIMSQQETYSQDIERRIEQYRAYADQLQQIRKNIYSFDYLKSQSADTVAVEQVKTIKFVIEVKNPSDTVEKELEEKHFLPKEIRAEHVADSKGFDVRFDEKKGSAYLAKKELFKAGEVKKYEIIIQDIWSFPLTKGDALQSRGQAAFKEIKNSVYANSGQYLFDAISKKIDLIKQSQLQEHSIVDHIGLFRVNTKRYADVEDLVNKIEQLLAIVRAKKLEELESGKVKNVLQKLKALRGLAALSEAIFKKGLSVTTVWKIIFGTLGFVAFVTSINFFIWIRRSGDMGEDRRSKGPIKEVPKPGAAPPPGGKA